MKKAVFTGIFDLISKDLDKMDANMEYVKCKSCERIFAELIKDAMVPAAEDCYKMGNVPVPNMGWLCSQEYANELEKKYGITFDRTKDGKVDYYAS